MKKSAAATGDAKTSKPSRAKKADGDAKPRVKKSPPAAGKPARAGRVAGKSAKEKPAKPARTKKVAAVAAIEVEAEAVSIAGPVPTDTVTASPAPLVGPPFPDTDYAVVAKLLTNFLAHEVRKVGVSRAVLGLSGGVDSAVSAAVAVRALGAGNVTGVFMPYRSSVPESRADAEEVAASLGIEMRVADITPQVDAYFEHHPDASRLRRGNKMARERMTILYDLSAALSALVIGTSNKTELLLGYGTLYGDMASALNPIGDLYKTQVWGLARHLELPASVIEKAPTADLWSGQTDETELGFAYHQVDRLLYRMIDERCSTGELVELGFESAFIERISRMVRSSQFKRRLPIIAKISSRSIDTDFRYSRDWGL